MDSDDLAPLVSVSSIHADSGIVSRTELAIHSQMYASLEQEKANPAAKIFNCAQRAHGNTLENVHTLIVMTVWTGVLYPKFAAGACMVYLAGRIAYTLGYTT